MSMDVVQANITGAGLAGLSAAITLARSGMSCRLISVLPSERAQSVLAEGGINGALNTMGEDDSPSRHFEDTMKAGGYIADEKAVMGLTEHAPQILMELKRLGAALNLRDERLELRNFGGQKKKRTAYARSSTGKILMTTLIDEARKYEAAGLIVRYSHHELADLLIKNGRCYGLTVRDTYTGRLETMPGQVILATGGLNGFFPAMTTGTVTNTGDASALAFARGVKFSNLEMIQYHPTTIQIAGKRCLVSEAARGEGGRLFVARDSKPWYFMEERYPELGNLMPRDVVSREIYRVKRDLENAAAALLIKKGEKLATVYLDMRHLNKDVWMKKLPDLRSEILHYIGIDSAKEPVPVEPGIHYFMGGIDVDEKHRTNIRGLFAAGECCSQYHGANRLGGNSTMGAIYGGRVAAQSLAAEAKEHLLSEDRACMQLTEEELSLFPDAYSRPATDYQIRDILAPAMGIVRNEKALTEALLHLQKLSESRTFAPCERHRFFLAEAMLRSAICRKESRGAHYREDYPDTLDSFKGRTLACFDPGEQQVHVRIQKCDEADI